MPLAEYDCLRCQKKWQQKPAPTQCPFCGHLYVRWTNYSLWA